jgi:hypothetical protein
LIGLQLLVSNAEGHEQGVVEEAAAIFKREHVDIGEGQTVTALPVGTIGGLNAQVVVSAAAEDVYGSAVAVGQRRFTGLTVTGAVKRCAEADDLRICDLIDQASVQAVAMGIGRVRPIDADRIDAIAVTVQVYTRDCAVKRAA